MKSTWKAATWRKDSKEVSDLVRAMTTWQSSLENMGGLAAFYESLEQEDPIPLDLLLQNADFAFREHFQMSSYMGNLFELRTLGAAPMALNLSFALVGCDPKTGKAGLMDAYVRILRAEACALRRKLPVLRLPGSCFAGAVTALRITDDAGFADTLSVSMTMNVFSLQVIHGNSVASFDYQHGQAKTTPLTAPAPTVPITHAGTISVTAPAQKEPSRA